MLYVNLRSGEVFGEVEFKRRLLIDPSLVDCCMPLSEETATLMQGSREWGRNAPCPCGSGRKFKKCHYGKTIKGETNMVADNQDSKEKLQIQAKAFLGLNNYVQQRTMQHRDALRGTNAILKDLETLMVGTPVIQTAEFLHNKFTAFKEELVGPVKGDAIKITEGLIALLQATPDEVKKAADELTREKLIATPTKPRLIVPEETRKLAAEVDDGLPVDADAEHAELDGKPKTDTVADELAKDEKADE